MPLMYWPLVGWMNSMSLRVCGILHVMCKPFLLSYSLNGGSCVDGVRSYTCNCLAGFTGDRCDKGQGWFCLVHLKQNKRTLCPVAFQLAWFLWLGPYRISRLIWYLLCICYFIPRCQWMYNRWCRLSGRISVCEHIG